MIDGPDAWFHVVKQRNGYRKLFSRGLTFSTKEMLYNVFGATNTSWRAPIELGDKPINTESQEWTQPDMDDNLPF